MHLFAIALSSTVYFRPLLPIIISWVMLLWWKEKFLTSLFRSLKFTYSTRREENSQVFSLYLVSLFLHIYKSNRNSALVHMSFEESETEESTSAHDVRRRCVGCYEKLRQQQSRETSATTAKRIKTFCPDCNPFFCLDCFNEKHFSK